VNKHTWHTHRTTNALTKQRRGDLIEGLNWFIYLQPTIFHILLPVVVTLEFKKIIHVWIEIAITVSVFFLFESL